MPIYEYRCAKMHVAEKLRSFAARNDALACHCGEQMDLIPSVPHCVPDGMYSYCPNIGSATAFERRREAIKSGERVIPKQDRPPEPGADR